MYRMLTIGMMTIAMASTALAADGKGRFEATDRTMSQQMAATPLTGDADVDFARRMIPHHQGAIDMAQIVIDQGRDPELKRMAQKMIDDQTREQAILRNWLSSHQR